MRILSHPSRYNRWKMSSNSVYQFLASEVKVILQLFPSGNFTCKDFVHLKSKCYPVWGTKDLLKVSFLQEFFFNIRLFPYCLQETNIVPQPASTPNSRCSSVQNMDNNTNDSVSAGIVASKTPTTVSNYIQPIGTPSQVTNQGNAMPGYPPQQPPQSQQSLLNSSG